LKYKLAEFRMVYALKSKVEALFSAKTYENYTEGFSDHCLSSVINSTVELKPKTICRLSRRCERFVESLEKGSGYILTHKYKYQSICLPRMNDTFQVAPVASGQGAQVQDAAEDLGRCDQKSLLDDLRRDDQRGVLRRVGRDLRFVLGAE
jgi:hypothetical protein